MKNPTLVIASSLALAGLALCSTVRADMVTDWNATLVDAASASASTDLPPVATRKAAIVQVAVFDAVNGIARKYEPYLVSERAPRGARQEAAAAQAAYTTLVALYPTQQARFDTQLAASLASLAGHEGNSQSIARGLAWGEHVANLVLAARSMDGSSATYPGYFGGTGPGVWRSLPTATAADGTLPAILPQWRYVVPFALASPDQLRPGPPPALTSTEYAADVNEIKAVGRVDSTTRTADQTQLALLWAAPDFNLFRVAPQVLPRHASLVENARLLALLGIEECDALIAILDAKYTYNFWRPYHAIRLADTDGNPLTDPDPAWTSLVFPPRHQEYPSAHAITSGGFMRVLARELGDKHRFILSVPSIPTFSWTFDRFSDAAVQVKEARVWAGIHYRNSVNVGGDMGVALGDYIVKNVLRPLEDCDEGHQEGDDGGQSRRW
jgi:hypothetical protein